ncbi:MAG: zinc-ribbon domain containing protein [Planctomycetes bacterium]|nr:zinc-ribbon domain containing protein [Planctomycetota bacterium]
MSTDIVLTCDRCEGPFLFTTDMQTLYKRNGFTILPNLCRECKPRRSIVNAELGRKEEKRKTRLHKKKHTVACAGCGEVVWLKESPVKGEFHFCDRCKVNGREKKARKTASFRMKKIA